MNQPVHCPDQEIARYSCYRTQQAIQVDGLLDEAAWAQAPWGSRV